MKRYYFYDFKGQVLFYGVCVDSKEAKGFSAYTQCTLVGEETVNDKWDGFYLGADLTKTRQVEVKVNEMYSLI